MLLKVESGAHTSAPSSGEALGQVKIVVLMK
jgi:hypothetical protein